MIEERRLSTYVFAKAYNAIILSPKLQADATCRHKITPNLVSEAHHLPSLADGVTQPIQEIAAACAVSSLALQGGRLMRTLIQRKATENNEKRQRQDERAREREEGSFQAWRKMSFQMM
jgi:hypothetical protein